MGTRQDLLDIQHMYIYDAIAYRYFDQLQIQFSTINSM